MNCKENIISPPPELELLDIMPRQTELLNNGNYGQWGYAIYKNNVSGKTERKTWYKEIGPYDYLERFVYPFGIKKKK